MRKFANALGNDESLCHQLIMGAGEMIQCFRFDQVFFYKKNKRCDCEKAKQR